MKWIDFKHGSAEKVSQRVFYLLIGLSVLIFLLFFSIGYDMPFEENPDFIAPFFTDTLIVFMVGLFLLALVAIVVSFVMSYRKSGKQEATSHRVPRKKIARAVWVGTFFLLFLSFLLGSSTPMLVNGENFSDWAWLKLSDMFVFTSLFMLVVAIGAVAFGATRYIRKKGK